MNRIVRARRVARRYFKEARRIDLERLQREQELGDPTVRETILREERRRGIRTHEDELADKALHGDLKA